MPKTYKEADDSLSLTHHNSHYNNKTLGAILKKEEGLKMCLRPCLTMPGMEEEEL